MLSNSSSSDPLPRWNQLYQCAIQELDNAKLLERVAEARRAILDRAEELLRQTQSEKRDVLKHALRTLKLLEEKAAREKSAAAPRPEMFKEIESLFDTLFAHPDMARLCENCGDENFNLNVTVSLFDSERSWNLRLPVCPECDRAEFLKLISRDAA